ncbi:MAG: transglycosylase SLT domain-containing protein [Vicinamibacteria bacterium]
MIRKDRSALADPLDEDLVHAPFPPSSSARTRTIVIRHEARWQPLFLLCLCLLLLGAVLLGHWELRTLDLRHRQEQAALTRFEAKVQQIESGLASDGRRRRLLLGVRDHILRVNPRVSLGDAYRYAELALAAGEKYPAVDPLLLVAIGTVESRYDPQAKSPADARGLYQIWPSTGRLLLRGLSRDYDEAVLYDPAINTEAAALYLDILFATYSDPQLVLAEYNGGPLNAGYFRAGVQALSAETRGYVPQVMALHEKLRRQFEAAAEPAEGVHRDAQRAGKTLTR